ncbi:hypothetical protein INT80_09215 [Gallibacterium anatis]|uniref:Uncharacterized protein n=1 Tax=Gallibacterium anatis TaxID=750 RepID=A0A930UXW3_9PAST|nr:hypothetical protein [Gallibacterium anatis]
MTAYVPVHSNITLEMVKSYSEAGNVKTNYRLRTLIKNILFPTKFLWMIENSQAIVTFVKAYNNAYKLIINQ